MSKEITKNILSTQNLSYKCYTNQLAIKQCKQVLADLHHLKKCIQHIVPKKESALNIRMLNGSSEKNYSLSISDKSIFLTLKKSDRTLSYQLNLNSGLIKKNNKCVAAKEITPLNRYIQSILKDLLTKKAIIKT